MTEELLFSPCGQGQWGEFEISWILAVAENQAQELIFVTPQDMDHFEITRTNIIQTIWKGHPLLGADFEVSILWKKELDTSLYATSFSWKNNTSNYAVEEVRFPALSAALNENSRFLKPENCGELVTMRYIQQKGKRCFYASMQWTAVFPAGTPEGFYLDCRDSEHLIKQYDCNYKDGKFTHASVFYVPLHPENKANYSLPYSHTLGYFSGSWFEAAQLYRSWALTQSWYAQRLPVREKLRDTAMWVWNRGTAEEVIPPVEKLQQDARVPVALDWYWWHHNPYDTDYPDFWPPRSGEEKFKQDIARLNEQNIFCQVYTNGMTWDIDTPSYEKDHGIGSLQVNRDKTPTAMMFNPYTRHRLAIMCGEAAEYHRKIFQLTDKLVACGLPGIYLDMIGSYAFAPCWNPLHHHAPGGGTYQKDGYYSYVQAIRRKHPELLLSTEYASEMMDLFESFIMLDSSIERCYGSPEIEAVPAFLAVYHGPGVTVFGSYAIPDGIPPWDPQWPDKDKWPKEEDWHKFYPYQFFIELARCVVWGIQPCVCNLKKSHSEEPAFEEEYRFILETARFYHANREILSDGRLLSPNGFECEKIPVKFMKRGIFTLPGDMTVIEQNQPAVLHSFWQSPAGEKVLITANYTDKKQSFRYQNARGKWQSRNIESRSYLKIRIDQVEKIPFPV